MALISGQPDPHHKKIVKTVAIETAGFYVFIDQENEIFFHVSDPEHQYPDHFNKINSIIRRLEVLVLSNLDKKEQSFYTYLLANTLGEVLEEKTIDGSLENLAQIEKDIDLVVNSNQKKYFSYGTNLSLLFVISIILILQYYRINILSKMSYQSFSILFCSLFGGIGSLIFNYSKTQKYISSRVIGKFYHFLDGSLRILYGVIYALIFILGVKSGMILNFINSESIYLFAFIGVLAGASDTFILAILKAVEQKSTGAQNNS